MVKALKRLRIVWMMICGVILVSLPLTTSAQPALGTPGTQQPGFPVVLSGSRIEYGSPVLADLVGDGKKDIIVGGTDGRLYAYKSDGTKLWEQNLGLSIQNSPAVGDINGDGYPEVIVGVSGDTCAVSVDGGVYALDRFGTVKWFFKPGDVCEGANGKSDGVRSSPTLANLFNYADGKMDIIFGAWDHKVYVLEDNGTSSPTTKWSYEVQDTIWSTAAVADINADGYLDIVIGTDISPPVASGGRLWVFDRNGSVLSGFPKLVDETIWSSPAVGDINHDGNLEIVVGTGFYWNGTPRVYAYDRYGNALPGWPVATGKGCFSSPALADFDGDGDLEVVIGCEDSKMYAWHYNGVPVAGWSGGVQPYDSGHSTFPFIRSSPIVADLDADGNLEILFSYVAQIIAMGANGALKTDDGLHASAPVYDANYIIVGSPAIGDIDNDGKLELVIGSSSFGDPSHGRIYAWKVGSAVNAQVPWPMFHRDPQHTGRASNPTLAVAPSSIYVMHQSGDATAEKVIATIRNTGDGSLNWSAAPPSGITVAPTSGTVTAQAQVTVTISTSGKSLGVHNLGNIVFSGTSGGSAVPGSPASIPVTLNIVQTLSKEHLPLILK